MTLKAIEDCKLRGTNKVDNQAMGAGFDAGRVFRSKKLTQWQTDFHLSETELDGVYSDVSIFWSFLEKVELNPIFQQYMEMMIQFAFIVLFSPAFPAAAMLCFLNNIVEIRVDSFSILITSRLKNYCKFLSVQRILIRSFNIFKLILLKVI